jgi:hypothetical protein
LPRSFADRIRLRQFAAGGDPATDITRDELASLARTVLSGFTATQHRACNVLTTVDGDIAHCRAMVDAWHTVPTDPGIADFYTARNNWLLRLKRVDGRWLITKWTIVTAAPSDGYQGVYTLPRHDRAGPGAGPFASRPRRCRVEPMAPEIRLE